MKRSYLKINVAIVLLTLIGGLQTVCAQKTEFGIKGGYNLSSLSTDLSGMKNKSGFHAGVLVEFKISEKFSIQPELLYSLEGGKYSINYAYSDEDGDFSIRAKEDIKLGLINLPVIAKYYIVDRFSVEVGPQIGYLVSAKSDYDFHMESDGESLSDAGEENIKDNMKSIVTSLNFGLAYQLKNNMFFQARYNLGLTNLGKPVGPIEDGDNYFGEVKNYNFQFSVGYKF